MKRLKELSKRLNKISNPKFYIDAVYSDKRLTDKMIELNTQNQLFEKGIDSEGKRLDDGRRKNVFIDDMAFQDGYAAVTIYGDPHRGIIGKIDKGLPYDRITLKDTGDFYKSFRVKKTSEGLRIVAETMKEDNDLIAVWGPAILGLTDENMEKIRSMARFVVQDKIREQLLKRAA